jgi:hypothetical protein
MSKTVTNKQTEQKNPALLLLLLKLAVVLQRGIMQQLQVLGHQFCSDVLSLGLPWAFDLIVDSQGPPYNSQQPHDAYTAPSLLQHEFMHQVSALIVQSLSHRWAAQS